MAAIQIPGGKHPIFPGQWTLPERFHRAQQPNRIRPIRPNYPVRQLPHPAHAPKTVPVPRSTMPPPNCRDLRQKVKRCASTAKWRRRERAAQWRNNHKERHRAGVGVAPPQDTQRNEQGPCSPWTAQSGATETADTRRSEEAPHTQRGCRDRVQVRGRCVDGSAEGGAPHGQANGGEGVECHWGDDQPERWPTPPRHRLCRQRLVHTALYQGVDTARRRRQPDRPGDVPRVTAHQLRHTAASLMIASGAHVKTVQRQLGHKTATMTLDNYGHLFEDDLDDVADRMSEGLRAAAQKCGHIVGTAPEDTSVAV
ncbi:tyrosine-type recombinase/integrase [Nocardia sp. NPDC051929]|uniref:tyrosine-type recombinase/integrase n=1 Tax=Nocardia sp. NPDC051929 TaxID=3364327 RepID=UPI0037CB3EB2